MAYKCESCDGTEDTKAVNVTDPEYMDGDEHTEFLCAPCRREYAKIALIVPCEETK